MHPFRLQGVVYLGALTLADTHTVISCSTAILNSSVSEGMSLAILEVINKTKYGRKWNFPSPLYRHNDSYYR